MVPMGKIFKKFKNVITPVVRKIESLFLVLGYGFRGWAIYRCYLNLLSGDLCCHGSEI